VKQTTLPSVAVLGRGYLDDDFHDFEDLDEDTKEIEGIVIYKVEGVLYFANAEKLKDSTQRIDVWGNIHVHPSEQPVPLRLSSIVFDLSELKSLDASGLSIFLDIVKYYSKQQRRVALVKLRKSVRNAFQRSGILAIVEERNLFKSLEQAVQAIQAENLVSLKLATPKNLSPSSRSISQQLNSSLSSSSSFNSLLSPGGRNKKSSFFAPPLVSSPLLRGMKKIPMT
jgi:anti-anti-sigma factor